MFSSDDHRCYARVCVSDIAALNRMRDDGLSGRLGTALLAQLRVQSRKEGARDLAGLQAPASRVMSRVNELLMSS